MGVIYLASGLLLGAALVRRIPFSLYLFEKAAMAVVLGLFAWTWLAFIAVLLMPYDYAMPLVVTASVVATLALWRKEQPPWRPLEGGRTAWIVWGVATVITIALLVPLFWSHSLVHDSQGLWSYAASWADYGLHASIISHITAASSLPGDLSVASGEKLTYPFLIDLLSAMYQQGGMTFHASLFIPGVLLGLSICQLLIAVGLRLFQRISVGVGGLGLALTIGSAAGTWTAWSDWRDSGKGLFSFLGHLPMDYTGVDKHNAHVTNFVVDALLPQRSILFGLGAGLIVLVFLIQARERSETKLLWPAALIVGLLPMAHPHTFIITVALFAALAAEALWRTRKIPWAYIVPPAVSLVMALPQIIYQQSANNGTGGRFRFGWQWEHGTSLLGYWWANFGLIGLALLAIPLVMRKHKQVLWFLPMLLVLVITQVYAFQPFEYDNLKLIYWVYIIGGFFIAYLAGSLVRRHRAWLVAIVPLTILVVVPGALAITREFQHEQRYQFANNDDLQLADWVRKNTPIDAVFAATSRPNVPVATLAGRSIVAGYDGWLYNFAIPYDQREAAIRAGLGGHFDDPGLRRYGAKYLLVATNEDPNSGVDQAALATHAVLWSNASWKIYQLN